MGLNFNYGNARWSYSGFHSFRKKLADEMGIDLDEMDGFKTENNTPLGKPMPGISWGTIKDDIKYLLYHSDCDGQLSSLRCKKIIPRLRKLIKSWSGDDYDKQQALELIKGMKEAIKLNKPLKFG